MPDAKDCEKPCWGPRLILTDVWRTCNKIRAAVFRGGLDLWSYFRPLDPCKNCLISEAQFVSILAGPLKDVIGLSCNEVAQLADYFRVYDGRIFYSQFCDIIHESVPNICRNPPLVTGLEWTDPYHVNTLSPAEECRLQLILTKIATLVNLRHLVLRPYFQDYELIAKNTGTVTITHFARVLHYLKILVSPDDFHLLIKKFSANSYTVNYVAFVCAIDNVTQALDNQGVLDVAGNVLRHYPGKALNAELPKLPRPEVGCVPAACVFGTPSVFHPVLKRPHITMEVREILRRFQRYVLGSRTRVGEFFKDFDPLRCGRITDAQFRRCLDMIGASAIQRFCLTEEEMDRLIAVYRAPNDPYRVCYRTFEDDIDQVFTIKELEKCPDLRPVLPPPEVSTLPAPGSPPWCAAPDKVRNQCECAVEKVKTRMCKRRMNIKPFFVDYDKHNIGHVTRNQFRQVLMSHGILLTNAEIEALEARYLDELGFNYLWFMREVEPAPIEEPLFDDFMKSIKRLNGPRPYPYPCPTNAERDIVEILAKIKGKVVREGIRVLEFLRPFDEHNEENISCSCFCRGLSTACLELTPLEMSTLIDAFGTPLRPGRVDYKRFATTVEEAVAQPCLERAPLVAPLQHLPHRDCCRNFLNYEERLRVSGALHKLARCPYLNLEECFQDHDHCHVGLVTPEQFRCVLSMRGVYHILSPPELECLLKCFNVRRGINDDFDFLAFCHAINILRVNKKRRVF